VGGARVGSDGPRIPDRQIFFIKEGHIYCKLTHCYTDSILSNFRKVQMNLNSTSTGVFRPTSDRLYSVLGLTIGKV